MGVEDNITDVAKSTIDAYKTSPLLTGLLILNLVFLVGFGWFLMKKNEAHEALVARIISEEQAFREEILQVALTCSRQGAKSGASGKPGYTQWQGE